MGGIDYSSLVQKHMSNFSSYTNVNTTTSSYSAPSTANQIADALLGVGSMAAMMAIASKAQGGGAASANASTRASAMSAKAEAQAYIKVYTPRLEQARAQLAASDTNYEATKKDLNDQLAALNKQAGVEGGDTKVSPNVVKYIDAAKAQLTTWQANEATYNSNEVSMKNIEGSNSISTQNGGPKQYITISNGNAKANKFTGDHFMKNYNTQPTDEKERATWQSAKAEADNKANQAQMTANQKESDYNRMSSQNSKIDAALQDGIKVQNADGTEAKLIAKDPRTAVSELNKHINGLNQEILNPSADDKDKLTAEQYQTKKAEIQGKLTKLEADHANKKGLEKTIENYELKIAEAQEKIDAADVTLAMLDAKQNQATELDGQIDQKKAYLKSTDQRKKFLGIKFGNNPADVKALRKQTKAEIADLKNQRSELS